MGYNVTALQDYINQVGSGEILKAISGSAPSIQYFATQAGVNQPTDIHTMSVEGSFGDGKVCSVNENTNFAFTDRQLIPAFVKQESILCGNELYGKWLAYESKFTASETKVPFEEELIKSFRDNISENLETWIWEGGNVGGKNYDGIKDLITNQVKAGATATVYDQVIKAIESIPSKQFKKTELFVSPAKMIAIKGALLQRDVRLMDLTFTNGTEVDENTIKMPVYGTLIHAVSGLADNDDKIYAIVVDHMVYGYSIDGAENDVVAVYDGVNDRTILRAKLSIAVQTAFPSENFYVERVD